MDNNQKIQALEKQVKFNRNHLRIVFLISSLTLLALVGHFILHATGKV